LYIWQLGLGGLSGHDALTSSATYCRVHLCCTSSLNPPNINTRTDGNISVVGETDLYSIQLTAGEKYIFTLEANSPGLDTGLNLFATKSASSQNLLETNNNAFKLNKNSRITYVT
jgi:hypothetical protein